MALDLRQGFEPMVNVVDKFIDTSVQRCILIECPGVASEDIDWEELPNGVKIRILTTSLV